jgi:hypothetical protein
MKPIREGTEALARSEIRQKPATGKEQGERRPGQGGNRRVRALAGVGPPAPVVGARFFSSLSPGLECACARARGKKTRVQSETKLEARRRGGDEGAQQAA